MTFDFRQQFTAAAASDDKHFAAFRLAADPLAGKLTAAQRQEIIAGAIQCGAASAQKLGERFASTPASEIAGHLRIKIVADAASAGMRLVLSSYDSRAAAITLNGGLIGKLKQCLAEEPLLPPFDPEELAIAHELFHFLEARDAAIFTRRFKISLWRLGPLQYSSTIPAASEIAATACAKALCRLAFNPLLLEPLILRWAGGESVEAWFARLAASSHPAQQ
jgi:hypothetical protein